MEPRQSLERKNEIPAGWEAAYHLRWRKGKPLCSLCSCLYSSLPSPEKLVCFSISLSKVLSHLLSNKTQASFFFFLHSSFLHPHGHPGRPLREPLFPWDCYSFLSYLTLVLRTRRWEGATFGKSLSGWKSRTSSAQPGMMTGKADIKGRGAGIMDQQLRASSGIELPEFNSWFCNFVAIQAIYLLSLNFSF